MASTLGMKISEDSEHSGFGRVEGTQSDETDPSGIGRSDPGVWES